jgi:hypothetical protein
MLYVVWNVSARSMHSVGVECAPKIPRE